MYAEGIKLHMSIKESLNLTAQNIKLYSYTSKNMQQHKHLYNYTLDHDQGMHQPRLLSVTTVLNDKQFSKKKKKSMKTILTGLWRDVYGVHNT